MMIQKLEKNALGVLEIVCIEDMVFVVDMRRVTMRGVSNKFNQCNTLKRIRYRSRLIIGSKVVICLPIWDLSHIDWEEWFIWVYISHSFILYSTHREKVRWGI